MPAILCLWLYAAAATHPALHAPIQGALLCLAAAAVGLGEPSEAYLRQIVPPVLASFTDQDSRVRYYACEALYNIAKVGLSSKQASKQGQGLAAVACRKAGYVSNRSSKYATDAGEQVCEAVQQQLQSLQQRTGLTAEQSTTDAARLPVMAGGVRSVGS